MPTVLEKGLSFFDRIFMAIAQLAIFTMMLSISADALGRYLFNRPLQGSFEFTTLYLMVILTFLGLPATYAGGGHIRLDVLRPLLQRIPGNPVERLNALIAASVFGFLAWHSGHEAVGKFVARDTSFGVIQFPLYWSYVWVPLGCGLLTLRLAVEIIYPRVERETAG